MAVPPPTVLGGFPLLEPFILSQAHHNLHTRQDQVCKLWSANSIVASLERGAAPELQHGVRAKETVV